jgi:hypothetical protein
MAAPSAPARLNPFVLPMAPTLRFALLILLVLLTSTSMHSGLLLMVMGTTAQIEQTLAQCVQTYYPENSLKALVEGWAKQQDFSSMSASYRCLKSIPLSVVWSGIIGGLDSC